MKTIKDKSGNPYTTLKIKAFFRRIKAITGLTEPRCRNGRNSFLVIN
jgi:hypothetical protein